METVDPVLERGTHHVELSIMPSFDGLDRDHFITTLLPSLLPCRFSLD